MAGFTGSKCRKCRQLNFSVCGSEHCALEKRNTPPGMHPNLRRKTNDYKVRLIEKQRLRYSYWIPEKQFRNYVEEAFKKPGVPGETLLKMLERRLDNLVYRVGFAPTVLAARQFVVHGHVLVNGRSVDRPSFLLRKGDTIALKEKSRKLPIVEDAVAKSQSRPAPAYMQIDKENLTATLAALPDRDQIPVQINEKLVMEHYTKYL
jgi:small subunit ribosomal protein S4